MIRLIQVCIVTLVVFCLAAPVIAGSPLQAWTLSKDRANVDLQMALMEQLSSPTNRLAQAKNKYFVELSVAELKRLKRGDELIIPFPNGLQNFSVTKRQINPSGTQTLTVRSQNVNDDGFVVVTLGGNAFHVTGQAGGITYTGRGHDSVGILVAENDYQRVLPSMDMDEVQVDAAEQQLIYLSKKGELIEQEAVETTIIDVLFYFTEGVRNLYNNEHQSRIDHIIAITNFILSESKTHVQIRGTSIEIDYTGTTSSDGLSDMFQQRNGFETIYDDRFLHGADAVTLLLPIGMNSLSCGSAYQPNPLIKSSSVYFLSALGADCSDSGFAHELGHNLGLNHSRRRGESGAAFDFGVGYGEDNEFYTTMAIGGDYYTNYTGPAQYKFVFSSPDLNCGDGLPCGIADGKPDSADAAQAIRLVADTVASTYDRNPNTTLAKDAIAKVTDPGLRQCLSNNEANNVSKYAAGWKTVICYDTIIEDLSGIERFENLRILDALVSGDLDLSALAGMNDIEVLNLRPTTQMVGKAKLTNLYVLADKPNLSTLSLNYWGITDIGFLRTMYSLKSLSLDGNPIEHFTPIFGLYQLQVVNLANTNFPSSQIGEFRQLKELYQLNLTYNNITELGDVEFPSSLAFLSLSLNKLVSLPNLDSATSLYELNVSDNPLKDIDNLANLVSLRNLSLTGTAIDDISMLAKLTQLTDLNIAYTKISSIDVVREYTELSYFNASNTAVTDISPALLHLSDSVNPNNWRDNFSFSSLTIPCWQQAYGESLQSDNKYVYFNNTLCFTEQDYSDYDGDRIANIIEVNLGLNPLSSDSNNDGVNDTLASSNVLDVDGDGKADLFLRNSDTYFNYGMASLESDTLRVVFGRNSEDIPIYGDFDGDGVTDIAMRRPSSSMWYVKNSSSPGPRGDYIQRIKFGLESEDVPVVADYDGDGITDFAVYRPSNKMWYVLNSSSGDITRLRYGLNDGDIPVTGDFDGDGKADIAVRRPSTHTWHIMRSGDGQEQVITFGLAEEDIPVPADYDGDGITDLAVRRPSTQMWYILNSSGEPGPFGDGIQRIRFGLDPADIPIVDDYDGDGKADIAVRRPSDQMQYILTSSGEGGDRGDGIMRVRFGLQEKYVPFQAPIHIRMQMVEDANEQ